MTELREVRLPADLCLWAEKQFSPRFASVEELLVFVLRELQRNDAARFDEAEERLIEDRLRDLGYI
jgi:hypothetical protein